MTDRYVYTTRDRKRRPRRNQKRWYRCRCGRWWGINKKCLCHCNAPPPSYKVTKKAQAASDRKTIEILESLGHDAWANEIRKFLP